MNLWDLTKLRWLAALPPEEARRLRRAAHKRTFESGSLVFSPARHPEFVYVLERGLVRIFRVSASGDEVSFGYVHPGEVFGELAAFADKPRESFAEAIRRSVVWAIPRKDFMRVIKSHPTVTFEVGRQIEGRFKRIEGRVEDLALRDTYSRLARVLLQLSDEFGEPRDGSISIEFPLTQSDLATFIGASRQTISTALRQMTEQGLVFREGRRFCLSDPGALRGYIERDRA